MMQGHHITSLPGGMVRAGRAARSAPLVQALSCSRSSRATATAPPRRKARQVWARSAAGAPALEADEEGGGPNGLDPADFLRDVGDLLASYVASGSDRSQPVVRLRSPDDLAEAFAAAGVGLALEDGQEPCSREALLAACQATLDLSVRTHHPLFFNQLFARADPVAIAGEWLAAAQNSGTYTYEVAPVFTVMEREVIARMARLVGPAFAEDCDGIFVPGGSISNLYSLHLARARADPDARRRGAWGGPRLVAFVSEHAHYSYEKSAMVLGLGGDNVVKVKCDGAGRMLVGELEAAIAETRSEGGAPFYVGATAATTVMGAFDPVAALAGVCEREGMWLHVDGSWGGSVLLSEMHRGVLDGLDRADSFAWNPHKMMGVPMQCSAFMARHRDILKEVNGLSAPYLFQQDKNFASLDLGDNTIQCSRRNDVFKLWLMWKAYGDRELGARVEHAVGRAELWEGMCAAWGGGAGRGTFRLVAPRSYTNVCFWYLPPSCEGIDPDDCTEEEWQRVHKVAPALKDRMQREGDAMITFQSIFGRPNFFRLVFASSRIGGTEVTEGDLRELMERMDGYGRGL